MNVVLNAIQAMPHGGSLRVSTTFQPETGAPHEPPSLGGVIEVVISDTGPGIEEEALTKIFDPYFTTKKLGIGLGLAITKKIVEEHGGQIHVKSRLHEGTMVTISLPVESRVEAAV
jgi:signal transduction histidine kinase